MLFKSSEHATCWSFPPNMHNTLYTNILPFQTKIFQVCVYSLQKLLTQGFKIRMPRQLNNLLPSTEYSRTTIIERRRVTTVLGQRSLKPVAV